MATPTLEKELTGYERQYWQAMQRRDTKKALELTNFPCLLTGSKGVMRVDEQAFIKMMESPRDTMQSAELSNIMVQRLSEDVAIVAYQVHEELLVEGKAVSFDAADSSTWIRRDGRWVCAAHTESIAGDSYGRDRKQAS
jgi:hypothetical protein